MRKQKNGWIFALTLMGLILVLANSYMDVWYDDLLGNQYDIIWR